MTKSLEEEGLKNHLEDRGIDYDEFVLYVERGANISRLLEIYKDRVRNRRTMEKYLDRLAKDRGFEHRNQLYV